MQTVQTNDAPKAIGPYSQAKIHAGLVFLSGQIPLDPTTGEVVSPDIVKQTECVLKNIEAVLREARSSYSNVIKTTCFLSNMADFAIFNELYGEKFISKPARSCIAAKQLPKNVLVEIEVIAFVGN
jgi:2-iminobutanoate/2-iminopropanoate deaminase